jgi:hypothetical protein
MNAGSPFFLRQAGPVAAIPPLRQELPERKSGLHFKKKTVKFISP